MRSIYSLVLVAIVAILPTGARAGDKIGNGGVAACSAFVQLVAKIGVALVNVGQERVDQVNRVIRVQELHQKALQFKCLPVSVQDRTAITLNDSNGRPTTTLMWESHEGIQGWKDMNELEKLDLASHELAVAAEVESDGVYSTSPDMVRLAKTHRNFAELKCESSTYINGVFMCVKPFMRNLFVNGVMEPKTLFRSKPKGICAYLGFKKVRSATSEHVKNIDQWRVVVDAQGMPRDFVLCQAWGGMNCEVYTTVGCEG
jgi:hypothetical protein